MGYIDTNFFKFLSKEHQEDVGNFATQIVEEFVRGTDKILKQRIEKKEIGSNDLVLGIADRENIRQDFKKVISEINQHHKISPHPYNLEGLK